MGGSGNEDDGKEVREDGCLLRDSVIFVVVKMEKKIGGKMRQGKLDYLLALLASWNCPIEPDSNPKIHKIGEL